MWQSCSSLCLMLMVTMGLSPNRPRLDSGPTASSGPLPPPPAACSRYAAAAATAAAAAFDAD